MDNIFTKGKIVIGQSGLIVLCSGEFDTNVFSGMVVSPNQFYKIGDYSIHWSIGNFSKCHSSITVITSNN